MNTWNFTGNLGRDSEVRYTSAGDAVVSFSVGVKSGYGDNASTTWAKCSMFGKRGESVAPYLTKGQLVGVSGEVSMREWEDRQGQKRSNLEVRVNDLTLLGKRDDSGVQNTQQAPQPQRQAPQQHQQPAHPADLKDDLDDIPF